MKRLVTISEFPNLKFIIEIRQIDYVRIKYHVLIRAFGDLQCRDVWQEIFDHWCADQGQSPRFTRGNSRTNRTEAEVVVFGRGQITDFVLKWIGIDTLLSDNDEIDRLSNVEIDVGGLVKLNGKLLQLSSNLAKYSDFNEVHAYLEKMIRIYSNHFAPRGDMSDPWEFGSMKKLWPGDGRYFI